MKHRISLRLRVTLLTGAVLAICAGLLTLGSLQSARIYFPLVAQAIEALPAEGEDAVSVQPSENASEKPVQVAENSSQPDMMEQIMPTQLLYRGFSYTSYIYFMIIVIVGIAAVYFAVGMALRPVKKLSREIKDIGENNLNTRLPESRTKDEIGELTKGFNLMMVKLDDSFSRQKRFTANAAHELKTPLATIKASMQVMNMDEQPTFDDYRDNANITEQSIERLIGVVDGLLMLASEGAEDFSRPITLQQMIHSIIEELSPLYSERNVTVHTNCSSLVVQGNPTLIRRVFYNIIENAYKYNKQNGQITILAQPEEETIQITVADTGIGIPQENLEYIFEPFYRVDKSRSRKIAGTGLGLSITRMILDKHQCKLSVESKEHQGTTFVIHFPQ